MENVYLVQLGGVGLFVMGILGLYLSANLYGRKVGRVEERRLERRGKLDEDRPDGQLYFLSMRWETLVAGLLTAGGWWLMYSTGFTLCAFLMYWLPGLPSPIWIFLSC